LAHQLRQTFGERRLGHDLAGAGLKRLFLHLDGDVRAKGQDGHRTPVFRVPQVPG
jgi:hypothetical protein